ncbi:MAG: hypothetical protein QXK93_00250 [Candidatus Bathyarchaeia archaeon]
MDDFPIEFCRNLCCRNFTVNAEGHSTDHLGKRKALNHGNTKASN